MNNVSAILMGGLGNQLFQIFHALAYGHRHHRPVIFPYSEKLVVGRERETYWDTFLSALKPYTSNLAFPYNVLKETGFSYSPIPAINADIAFFGYWQSYKYFEEEKHILFQQIKLYEKMEQVRSLFPFLENTRYISMHFRMGDYKLNPGCHPILPVSYYEQSIRHICLLKEETRCSTEGAKTVVLYFCEKEDIEDVSAYITQLILLFPEVEFVKIEDTIPDWQQMLLMSLCSAHIIANSTFSWWGAYFDTKPDKMVCYPDIWFGEKIVSRDQHTVYVQDLFPTGWTKISVR